MYVTLSAPNPNPNTNYFYLYGWMKYGKNMQVIQKTEPKLGKGFFMCLWFLLSSFSPSITLWRLCRVLKEYIEIPQKGKLGWIRVRGREKRQQKKGEGMGK